MQKRVIISMTMGLAMVIYPFESHKISQLSPLLAQNNIINTQRPKISLSSLEFLHNSQELVKKGNREQGTGNRIKGNLISARGSLSISSPLKESARKKNLISQTSPLNLNPQNCQGEKILSELICAGDNLNSQETELYQLINQYRTQQGLSSIPLSPSLSRVANRHLQDLQDNLELYDRSGKDWHFGWSNCSYDANNPNTFSCMWAAPQRLKTAYPGKAYELLCGGKRNISPQEALNCWQKSSLNNDVLINQEDWRNYRWNAIGIAINEGYATVWLGQENDKANQNTNPPKPVPKPGRIW
ncbi:CAP domain-containing protein [Gloeothece verrucosa]|nr:CAP domain-containing protein [Gloeothece verrucosa]